MDCKMGLGSQSVKMSKCQNEKGGCSYAAQRAGKVYNIYIIYILYKLYIINISFLFLSLPTRFRF